MSLWLTLAVAIALPALLPLIEVTAAESALADALAQNGSLTVGQNVADVDTFGAFERNVDNAVAGQLGGAVVLLASSASVGPFSAFSQM